jgi:hypothetical protein
MLHAIINGKAGRNFQSEVNWRDLFKGSEDSLTASVFGMLFHLPVEVTWSILRNSCYGKELPAFAGPLLTYEFWPRWSGVDTDNSSFVEPDVFLRFQEFDLIVEAKRWDDNQQSQEQWENEFQAYLNEYESDRKKVFLLALGGLNSENSKKVEMHGITMPVVKSRWRRLLSEVRETHKKMSASHFILNGNDAVLRILDDLMKAFQLHGFATGEWFEEWVVEKYRLKDSLNTLQKNPLKFDGSRWFGSMPAHLKIDSRSLTKLISSNNEQFN